MFTSSPENVLNIQTADDINITFVEEFEDMQVVTTS